ncbi:acyloxyacyl hydrolase [Geofilum rubicundum]|uniref:Deacylase n=1 Tax=Geofilum rubicundum JCM 15548 TaxID=1236989 RepID=A0A0E9M3F3_9BACT|nr:acyloxyacyl hydrolase [Geofilum rubicundum]GAO31700.1 hypothetical protein JCM15548_14089 [Geofilum rubicundum JCM 15548]
MIHSKYLSIIFLLWLVPIVSFGGNKDSTRYAIEAKYHLGIVVPHHTSMTYLINDYARGGEINLIRQRHRSGLWESYLNRPETGIGLWFSTFGRPDIYGEGFAIYPFINFRLFQLGQLQAKSRVALGLGFANKPFEVGVNTYNTVFGSHLNAYIGFGFLLNYPVTDRVALSGSFSLNHMSNGSSRKPNNGINTATFTLGAIYELSPVKAPDYHPVSPPPSSAREWLTTLSAGRNQAAAYNPTIYWSGSLTTTHLWYTTKTRAYGLGLDFIRFGGAPLASKNFQDMDENAVYSFKDELYAGLFGTMESHMGSTALYIAAGGYLYHATKPRQPVYARLGVRQKLTGNLLAHFGIKANFFTAEFIEFGLGYRWGR